MKQINKLEKTLRKGLVYTVALGVAALAVWSAPKFYDYVKPKPLNIEIVNNSQWREFDVGTEGGFVYCFEREGFSYDNYRDMETVRDAVKKRNNGRYLGKSVEFPDINGDGYVCNEEREGK